MKSNKYYSRYEALFWQGTELPTPSAILGDLAGDKENWPAGVPGEQRMPYLRETEAHADLVYHFTKRVVSTGTFNSNCGKTLLNVYLWASLESFLVVQYVIHYPLWMSKLKEQKAEKNKKRKAAANGSDAQEEEENEENEESSVSESSSSTTTKQSPALARARGKYSGWSPPIVELYNKIHEVLKEQRKDVSEKVLRNFETNMRERFKDKDSSKTRWNAQPRKKTRSDEEEYFALIQEDPSFQIVPL